MTAQIIEASNCNLSTRSSFGHWVIIDSHVDSPQILVDAVLENSQAFLLDKDRDGIEQITQLIQQANIPPKTLHLVSHGASGTVFLGNTQLDVAKLETYSAQIRAWSLENLYLYGCEVASGTMGQQFLHQLHHLTHANIAASSTKVGHSDRGGNWILDTILGCLDVVNPFKPSLQASYSGVFNTQLVVTEDNANNSTTLADTLGPDAADGDFGKGIRVGANFAVTDEGVPLGEIQPIEFGFDVNVPIDPALPSFLILSVFDVDYNQEDPESGEINDVFFNKELFPNPIGFTEGQNELSFRTVLRLTPTQILQGTNLVEIQVDRINSAAPANAWEAEIERAELILNYELENSFGDAFLDFSFVDQPNYDPGEQVLYTADVDTTLPEQIVQLEAILRDPTGVAVAFDARPESADFLLTGESDDDLYTWPVTLPSNAQTGIWSIDLGVFDDEDGSFQFLGTETFRVGDVPDSGTAFLDFSFFDQTDYSPGDTVQFTADIDTLKPQQNVRIEAVLRDPNGAAVTLDNRPELTNYLLIGDNDEDAYEWPVALPPGAQPGIWSIDLNVTDAGTGVFQFAQTETFSVGTVSPGGPPEPTGPLVFQFKDFVVFENLDDNRPYQGPNAAFGNDPVGGFRSITDEELYLLANPDVQAAINNGTEVSGADHYTRFGRSEGRNLLPLDYEINGLKIDYLFDETYYLDQYQDVAQAVADGTFVYGYEHFIKFGILEGRNPSLYYDESLYVNANEDVQGAISNGSFKSGLEHYLLFGHLEDRKASNIFDAADYVLNNQDVSEAIADGRFKSGFDHYIEFGASEGRVNTLLYEEYYYLRTNEDVANALAQGGIGSGFEHYVVSGQSEERDPSAFFDESAYQSINPDVEQGIDELISSGMEHYFRFGRQEDRSAFKVPTDAMMS